MTQKQLVYRKGTPLRLSSSQFIASGGEGSVYRVGQEVFKVYAEPGKAHRAGMEQKLQILAQLRHPGISSPLDLLHDKQGQLVGFVSPYVAGEALCTLFTNTWQQSHRFDLTHIRQVVQGMREVTDHAHQHQALMVDANEMNWLVHGTHPVAIDVDSWQIPGHLATAIMPSIRDWSSSQFTEGTDWFAWAIVTFQLWTGIHPYKGTHPDFKRSALEDRMKAKASVFDAKVRLPAAVRPLQTIPAGLLRWYERMFSSAHREAPPVRFEDSPSSSFQAVKTRVEFKGSSQLRIDRLGHVGTRVLRAGDGFMLSEQSGRLMLWDALAKSDVSGVTPEELLAFEASEAVLVRGPSSPILVRLTEGDIQARALGNTQAFSHLPLRAQKLWSTRRRVFAQVEGLSEGLVELDFAVSAQPKLLVKTRWPVNVQATRFFRGGFVQDCLGMPFIGIVGPQDGLQLAPAPALKGFKVVDGFILDADNAWVTCIKTTDGQSYRLRLALTAGKFAVQEEDVVDELSLNAAATLSGVGVLRDGDDLLVARGAGVRRVSQVGLPVEFQLFSTGPGIAAFEGGQVVQLSLTK